MWRRWWLLRESEREREKEKRQRLCVSDVPWSRRSRWWVNDCARDRSSNEHKMGALHARLGVFMLYQGGIQTSGDSQRTVEIRRPLSLSLTHTLLLSQIHNQTHYWHDMTRTQQQSIISNNTHKLSLSHSFSHSFSLTLLLFLSNWNSNALLARHIAVQNIYCQSVVMTTQQWIIVTIHIKSSVSNPPVPTASLALLMVPKENRKWEQHYVADLSLHPCADSKMGERRWGGGRGEMGCASWM